MGVSNVDIDYMTVNCVDIGRLLYGIVSRYQTPHTGMVSCIFSHIEGV